VQASLKLVLEPVFEAGFKPCSYGFRPMRRAQDAIEEIHHFGRLSYEWILEGDIASCLVPSSHCLCVHEGGVEESGFGRWDPYSEAFSGAPDVSVVG